MNQKTILHLPKWYPNRTDDLFGIFTKRHILSTKSLVRPIVVFGVVDVNLKRTYEIITETEEGVETIRFYFKKHFTNINAIDKLIKLILYFYVLNKCVRQVKKRHSIDLIHIHVLLRTGFYGFFQKTLYKIPYVITEHWTIYLPQKIKFLSYWRKQLSAFIVRKSENLNTVSQDLLVAMNRIGIENQKSQSIIGNSVDTEIFKPEKEKSNSQVFSLITVVEFNEKNKNICGLLDAMKNAPDGIRLDIVGYGKDELLVKNHAEKLNLDSNRVIFYDKMYQEKLAPFISDHDVFVLFSKTENLPCVILEAMACGVPVIATDVGGVNEMIQSETGILIPSEDERALLEAISFVKGNSEKYNSGVISKSIFDQYSSESIGRQFNEIYEGVL